MLVTAMATEETHRLVDAQTYVSEFVVTSKQDLALSGGSSVTNAGCPPPAVSIRSGNQHQTSIAALTAHLASGVTVTKVGFAYRYTTGYSGPIGANFTLRVAGAEVYKSPLLTKYPYTKAGDFSPPVQTNASGLSIPVSLGKDHIEIDFQANDRNLQVLLPLTVEIHCTGGPCTAQPRLLPKFFDSNMVLQRAPQQARVWGHNAQPGDEVTVKLSGGGGKGGAWTTKADAGGVWAVTMSPQPAHMGPHTITVTTKEEGRSQKLENVAFGDVILCSGQSNMAFSTNLAFNASAEIAASAHYPGLRFFTAATVAAGSPQFDLKPAQQDYPNQTLVGPYARSSWAVSAPNAFVPADGPTFTWPSAVCYFTGRDLYEALDGKVPIGLLTASWGGEPIEPFMSPDALKDKTCGGTKPGGQGPLTAPRGGSAIWNGMIAPLAQMRFASVLWYQGESNAGNGRGYECSFPAMIHDWRAKFTAPDLPFLFVVLAPCAGHKWCANFVNVRNAQFAGLLLPKTAYAVAVDLGDLHSPARSVHPRRKQEVGRRLALSALKVQYGRTNVVSTGPVFKAVAVEGAALRVSYAPGTAHTLHTAGTGDCSQCCAQSPFEVLHGDNQWVRANFTLSGETVTVHMPAGVTATTKTGVRYGWEQWAQCALYNGKGAPGTGPNGTQPVDAPGATGIAGTPFCWNGTAPCPVV